MGLINLIKKYWPLSILIGVSIVILTLLRSCAYTDEYITAANKYAVRVKELHGNILKLDKVITQKEAEIAGLDKANTYLNYVISQKNTQLEYATKKIDGLNDALAGATTDAERVPILVNLVAEWTNKFNLSDAKCKDYQGIIFNLQEKYSAQVVITDQWKAKYGLSESARADADAVIAVLRKDLRRAKLFGGVKTIGVMALAGVVICSLISK